MIGCLKDQLYLGFALTTWNHFVKRLCGSAAVTLGRVVKYAGSNLGSAAALSFQMGGGTSVLQLTEWKAALSKAENQFPNNSVHPDVDDDGVPAVNFTDFRWFLLQ